MDTKKTLRRELLARRRAMTPDQLEASTTAICDHLRIFAQGYRIIAAYEPFGTEPGGDQLLPLLTEVSRSRILLPILREDNDLDWGTKSITMGPEGIGEAQLIVVPALAVDLAGFRLGRGGGSYDMALARSSPSAVRVALLHEGEILPEIPTEPHDQRVHFAITAAGVTKLDR